MYLVFDIGGTQTRLALSPNGRELGEIVRSPTDVTAKGFASLLGAMKELVGNHKLKGLAGGLPGHLNAQGLLERTANLPEWAGLPVQERLQEQFGVPVHLANDAALAGLGEATAGAGAGAEIVVYITVSTGINGVRIVRRQIEPSASGFEIGQQLLLERQSVPVSLQELASGAAVEAAYGQPPGELRGPGLWRQEAVYVARGLYNTLLHWSPDVVVYGGSMMRDISLEAIRNELEALPDVYGGWPPILAARLGDEAGLRGALELLRQKS